MLNKFFSPKSIALIGASREQGKVGHEILKNLILGGFQGSIYPVNPKAAAILGKTVYKNITDIPCQEVDLAIIVIPAQFVQNALVQCASKNIKAAIIISAGLKSQEKKGPRGKEIFFARLMN